MTARSEQSASKGSGRRALSRATLTAAVCLSGAMVLGGCGVISAVHKAEKTVRGNSSTIDAFTSKMQSTPTSPFEATYVTTGSSPATVVYAVNPPTDLAFSVTQTAKDSSGNLHLITNSDGEFACTEAEGTSKTTCTKLPANSSQIKDAVDFYTPSHWVNFLKGASLAAGLAGDQVSTSSMSLNGFNMSCVDLTVKGQKGTSTICTTEQGILGYVKVAGDSTSFQIKSYSTSPDSSLFQLPAGATVNTIPSSVTSTTA